MKPSHPKSAARHDIAVFNTKAVLVVDDDRQLVEALKWIFNEEEITVDVAYDGDEALGKLKEGSYDAVVCDVVMPKMDGPNFHAQATELFPDLAEKFIFITGEADDPRAWEFITGKQTKCLLKPFPIDDLMGELKKKMS